MDLTDAKACVVRAFEDFKERFGEDAKVEYFIAALEERIAEEQKDFFKKRTGTTIKDTYARLNALTELREDAAKKTKKPESDLPKVSEGDSDTRSGNESLRDKSSGSGKVSKRAVSSVRSK